MNYEEKLREIINSNSEYYPSEDKAVFAKYFPELKESEDERIRQELCDFLRDNMLHQDAQYFISWLERQGEQKPFPKQLDADKVIEWLNDQACLGWIEDIEVEKFVEQFKKDFEL